MTDQVRTYYGRPVVKPPAWTWEVPWYLFTGGLAGVSSLLAAVADSSGNRELARRAWTTAAVAATISPALLISDLKRPRRFFNMLRVFRPTSPLNMGSWLLAAYVPAAVAAAVPPTATSGRLAGRVSALLGPVLATYTAVLVSDTAIPTWHEARHELPFLFAGSAAASAGGAALMVTPLRHGAAARHLALAGAVLELGAGQLMEARLGDLAEPYRRGKGGIHTKLAKGLTAGGGILLTLPSRPRGTARLAAVLLIAGSLAQRWAVFHAGTQGAEEPEFTVTTQRQRSRTGR